MNNKILAVIVVVALVAVAAGTILMINNDKGPSSDPATGRLWVYGNANNDDYLDDRDIDYINSIINGDIEWDKENYPYADTNTDGVIDNKDVELLKKILNKEECLVYYTQNWAGEYSTSYIHYPITGSIGCNYYQAANMTTLLGIWDRVTAAESVVTMSYTDKYPNVENLYPLGALGTMETETVIASGIDVMIAYTNADSTGKQIQKELRDSGSKIDVIALPIQGYECISAVITMGVLLNCEEAAYKYVDYCEKIVDYIEDRLSSLKSKDYAEYYIIYNPTDPGNLRIQSENKDNGRVTGDLSFVKLIPGVNLMPYGESNWYSYRTAEWMIADDPEYILVSMASTTSNITHEAAQKKFDTYTEIFKGTGAYDDKNIIGFSFGMMSTYSGCASLVLLAAAMYPDLIDEEYGWEVLQEWYDEFTFEEVDVKKVGGAVYGM